MILVELCCQFAREAGRLPTGVLPLLYRSRCLSLSWLWSPRRSLIHPPSERTPTLLKISLIYSGIWTVTFLYIVWISFRNLSSAVIRGHLPLPSPWFTFIRPVRGFIAHFPLCIPPPSSSWRFKRGMFLILGWRYPRRFSGPAENAEFDRQVRDHFSTIFRASKNPIFVWVVIWLISSCFLITGHCLLFAPWLPSQFRQILIQDPSCHASPHGKHCCSFVQQLFMWPDFPLL
jgi:hypothetical protein